MHMPFQLPRTFCGVEPFKDQNYVIVGAPTDSATTFRSGSRMGPGAIRDASLMLCDGEHEWFPASFDGMVGDAGDMGIVSGNVNQALAAIQNHHSQFVQQRKHVITLGGDHSITLACLRSLHKQVGPMAMVHFDAHCDTWEDHFGEKYGHGTWLRNAIEEGLVDANHCVSIGIRSPAQQDVRYWLKNQGGTTITAREAAGYTPITISDMILHATGQQLPTYLSFDIDCLDPSFAPGTGTPEIGGLSSLYVSSVLDHLPHLNWCGMDLVEVAPAYDHSQITALAAATFVWQYLSMNIYKQQKHGKVYRAKEKVA